MIDENESLRKQISSLLSDGCFVFVPSGPGSLLEKNGIFIPKIGYEVLCDDDFYPVSDGNKFGINHIGLMRLARCAGIEWETESDKVGRVDNMNNPDYCSYRMVAQIRLADGRLEPYPAQKHIDLSEEKNKAIISAQKNFDFLSQNQGKTIKGKKIYPPYPKEIEKFIDLKVASAVGQKRAHIDELCESGAQNRAIKKAMLIPPLNPLNENRKICCMVGKPFYIVRYILNPLRKDVLNAQLGQLSRAKANIYGIEEPEQPRMIDGAKDITPKEEPAQDDSLLDFENISKEEKVSTIEALIEKSGYGKTEHLEGDLKRNGPLKDWDEGNLVAYFKFLKGEKWKK